MRKLKSVRNQAGWAAILGLTAVPLVSHAEAAKSDSPGTAQLEEVIVTATKRAQDVRDVSGSITAVTQQALQKLNAQSLSDYINRVPSVVFNDYQPGVSEVVIRGVASTTYHEANQATTGYYLNEVPLIEPGFPLVIPDIDTFDLSRVEVLRGPQGTLFGSSSLGGAINYVANVADTSGFDAAFEGMLSDTRRADDPGYGIKGMVNIPLMDDKLALRVVGLTRYDSGYLDNTLLGEKGSNDLTVNGARASLVWKPNDTTTLSLLSFYQEYDLDDQTYVLFGPPKTFERATNVAEFQDTDMTLNSLRLDHDFSAVTLTAIASYAEKNANLAFDYSIFGGNDPRTNTPLLASGFGESTTAYGELRLTSRTEGRLDWLAGVNYTHLETDSTDALFLEGIGAYIDANPGEFDNQPSSEIAPGDLTQRTLSSSDVTEAAIFGEVTYGFTDTLKLTVGGRYFQYESEPRLQFLPNADLIPPFDYQPPSKDESDFVPKVALTWTPNDRFMGYVLYSEGFRIGGINVYSVATPGLPLEFDSDSTTNYEIGTRFDFLDKRVLLDVTAFHMDWDNVQARLFTPVDFLAYTVNGGGAEIDGVELSALLPDSFAPGGGYPAGTQLPGASEWTVSNTIGLRFDNVPLSPRIDLSHRYLSEAPVAFGATLEKGGYNLFDLNAAISVGDHVEIGLFVKNLTDEYGILNAPFSFAGSVVRPRTIGATVRYSMK